MYVTRLFDELRPWVHNAVGTFTSFEKNNYSLGYISADKCRCAYAIGSPNATNINFRLDFRYYSRWPDIDDLLP